MISFTRMPYNLAAVSAEGVELIFSAHKWDIFFEGCRWLVIQDIQDASGYGQGADVLHPLARILFPLENMCH